MATLSELLPLLFQELAGALQSVDSAALGTLRSSILAAPRVFVDGQGRSGLQMRGFAMRLMHLGITVHVVGEVTAPAIEPADTLVLGSASGQTASLVGHARCARAAGAHIALITATDRSPLATEADTVIVIAAPTPKLAEDSGLRSIQPMGTLFEQSLGLLLDLVTVQLMDELRLTPTQMLARHANLE
ncbi:MAG: SIS domain-containing protein [Chloroflexi bacterium]|nr:SIS domain-containing protein [Chloroflexota bacterium]